MIIVGVLFLIFSYGQFKESEDISWAHILYILGIVVFGVGSIFAGRYPEDPKGIEETISGKIHGIASGLGLFFLILIPFWSNFISEFEHFKIRNNLIFIAVVLTFILFLSSENKTNGILKYTGLLQRLNLIILYSFLIINFILLKQSS